MTRIQKALCLAAAILFVAVLTAAGIVPERIGQFAPIALIALFPSVWADRGCARNKAGA